MVVAGRRALLGASAATFVAVGSLRAIVQLTMTPRSVYGAALLVASTILISLFWVPVTVAIAATWRWRDQPRRFIAANVGVAFVVCCAEPGWVIVAFHLLWDRVQLARFPVLLLSRLDTNLLFVAAIGGALWAVEYAKRNTAADVAAARLDSALADARLHVLTLQLHPHFLFNTLNLISQLAYRDVTAARRTLANLRGLLVRSLEQSDQRDVSLGDELRFLTAYLEIQQRRFGDRLRVRVDVTDEARTAAVPHLLLQPLVENAIAHGIGDRAHGGEIHVRGHVTGGRLLLSVEDNGVGPRAELLREGVGLTNTRLRLHQISEGDYRFSFGARPEGGAIVSIAIPVRAPSALPELDHALAVEDDETDDDAPRQRARGSMMLQLVAGWAAVAMVWTELEAVNRVIAGESLEWGAIVWGNLVNAAIWAVLTPGVLWLARRIDVGARWAPRRIALHALAAVAAAAIHIGVYFTLLRLFTPVRYHAQPVNLLGWAVWDMLAYFTILVFATVVTLGARHRESRARMAVTRARLARARLASLRLHLQPGVLLAGLDAIDTTMAADPERAERAIACMGDLLRLLLARADRDTVSLASEIAALRAYVGVTGSTATFDVDPELDGAELPAVLLAPLASSLASVARVSVRRDGPSLSVEVASRDAGVDVARLDQVRHRLRHCLGDHWQLAVRHDRETVIALRVPLTEHAGDVDDVDVHAARSLLVVA